MVTDDKISLAFPRLLGGLTFVEHHPYRQPGMGYSIRYENAEAMKADIYVYDGGINTIPTGHADQVIAKELANAERGIRFYEQKGAYLDVDKLGEGIYPERFDDQSIAFRSSRHQYRQTAQLGVTFTGFRVSETFICGFKNHFIKVRVTYPKSSSDSAIGAREKLMQHLIALLTQDYK